MKPGFVSNKTKYTNKQLIYLILSLRLPRVEKLRLEVASSSYPEFSHNINTGHMLKSLAVQLSGMPKYFASLASKISASDLWKLF
jgi:hypothetical protein